MRRLSSQCTCNCMTVLFYWFMINSFSQYIQHTHQLIQNEKFQQFLNGNYTVLLHKCTSNSIHCWKFTSHICYMHDSVHHIAAKCWISTLKSDKLPFFSTIFELHDGDEAGRVSCESAALGTASLLAAPKGNTLTWIQKYNNNVRLIFTKYF